MSTGPARDEVVVVSALGPDCDPDMSITGSPVRCGPDGAAGSGRRSTAVLLGALVLALIATGTGSGAVSVLAGGVALATGLVLARRGLRAARRFRPTAGRLRSAPHAAVPGT